MGLLRSEPMSHGTLVLPVDRAREYLDLIGSHVKLQFEDMNARVMQRPYKKFVQRIDELERIIRFLFEELSKVPGASAFKNNVESFLDNAEEYKLDEVETHLKRAYQTFISFKANSASLLERQNEVREECYVVETAMASMARSSAQGRDRAEGDEGFVTSASQPLRDNGGAADGRRAIETVFSTIAGVILREQQDRFARTLFRAARGNAFTHFQQIPEVLEDPKSGRWVQKSVFVIYFQDQKLGSSASAMNQRITKLCTSFGVNVYPWPESREAAEERRLSLQIQLSDQERLLDAHHSFVRSEAFALLQQARVGSDSLIEEWRLFCVKEKAIYATLNLFEGEMNLRASCWYPESEEEKIRALLLQHSGSQYGSASAMLVPDRALPSRSLPPTYIKVNEFTSVFQELVDTYGLPRYQEANPALLTTVTFPFLFGVMYGDIGHGLMLLLIGAYALWKADELKFTVPELHSARYILFMMGLFAVYCGFLYNDMFSIGLSFFGSRWSPIPKTGKPGEVVELAPLYDVKNEGGPGPYPFGLDPAWHGAQNELVFQNSMKMKLSVIIGVSQMIVGLLLRFCNSLHQRNLLDFICECVPMMVFMICFFGFMDYMILYKWVMPLDDPPSIINSLIAMAMWQEDTNPMFGTRLPQLLMGVSMLAVPVMLIPKPLVLRMRHKAQCRRLSEQSGEHRTGRHVQLSDEEQQVCDGEGEEEDFEFGEVFIHQVIETIEFVLGTVSHTASYLRLWALSLAHQQLSAVFFSMTLLSGMSFPLPLNIIATYLAFAFWFGATVAILLGMDVMECFLHTLRLHWVEFQSKFYRADGYRFQPFSHRMILKEDK
eukprot:TRINITY_DN108339_c0_g1_i1.p1 TRINITY_DN108339_c0_g1~~TRINITY_DN108339_c0_g1_i1.p1  ORF type:complete len:834 (+),score=146.71 TRINITY_DN108339_c0_g1_i1:91-2592(+)